MTTAVPGWPVEGRVIRRAPAAARSSVARQPGARGGPGWEDWSEPEVEGPPDRRWTPGVHVDLRQSDLRPVLVWLACFVAALVAFRALGATALASPPVTDPAAWWSWAQGSTADQLAFNLLRILGVALCWYLVGVTTVGVLARLARWRGLVRVADRLTVGPVRQLLQVSLGALLAAGAVTQIPGTENVAPAAPFEVAVGTLLPPSIGGLQPVVPRAVGAQIVERMDAVLVTEAALVDQRPAAHDGWTGLLGTHEEAGSLAREATGDARPDHAGEEVPDRAANPDTDAPGSTSPITDDRSTHVVAAGDHFWSLAEDIVGPGASESEVTTYWEQLVDVNRPGLVDRGNPDLLLPGQVIVIPAWPVVVT